MKSKSTKINIKVNRPPVEKPRSVWAVGSQLSAVLNLKSVHLACGYTEETYQKKVEDLKEEYRRALEYEEANSWYC